MGDFKFEIKAVGGHGCARTAKQGDALHHYCNRMDCPDCLLRKIVREFKMLGMMVHSAELTHWPNTPSEVVDDLLNGIRTKGHF